MIRAKMMNSCLNLSKLQPKYCRSLFPDTVYISGNWRLKINLKMNLITRSPKILKEQNQAANTSASARRIYDKRGGAVQTKCNTLAPFSKATFPSLTVCLYLLDLRARECSLRQASKHNFGLLWPWTMTSWLEMCGNDFRVPIPFHSHDIVPIPGFGKS